MIARRSFLTGLGSLLATPAIVHAGNLMPVKLIDPVVFAGYLGEYRGITFIDYEAKMTIAEAHRIVNNMRKRQLTFLSQWVGVEMVPKHKFFDPVDHPECLRAVN